jgi:hypothetical protein
LRWENSVANYDYHRIALSPSVSQTTPGFQFQNWIFSSSAYFYRQSAQMTSVQAFQSILILKFKTFIQTSLKSVMSTSKSDILSEKFSESSDFRSNLAGSTIL